MARDGNVEPWAGVWLSSPVLAPIGVFPTWRALNDSTLFDWDAYKIFFIRIGKRIFNVLKKHGIITKAFHNRFNAMLHKKQKLENQ